MINSETWNLKKLSDNEGSRIIMVAKTNTWRPCEASFCHSKVNSQFKFSSQRWSSDGNCQSEKWCDPVETKTGNEKLVAYWMRRLRKDVHNKLRHRAPVTGTGGTFNATPAPAQAATPTAPTVNAAKWCWTKSSYSGYGPAMMSRFMNLSRAI